MAPTVSTSPTGVSPVAQFLAALDELAVKFLPVKGLCSDPIGNGIARYYRLVVDGITLGSLWVIIDQDPVMGLPFALISGEGETCYTPASAFDALRDDCRERLLETGRVVSVS
jgi:hypothetical protein